jgi:hypothetical protein
MENISTKFKNTTTPSAEGYREVYFHYFFLRPFSVAAEIFAALYVASMIFAVIYKFVTEYALDVATIIATACLCFIFLLYVLRYRSTCKNIKTFLASQTENPPVTICFGEELFFREGEEMAFYLKAIRKVYSTKNYIYIIMAGRRLMMLSRRGFTLGSEEDFFSYLSERGVPVQKRRPTLPESNTEK